MASSSEEPLDVASACAAARTVLSGVTVISMARSWHRKGQPRLV
jgi:hypothetical protein